VERTFGFATARAYAGHADNNKSSAGSTPQVSRRGRRSGPPIAPGGKFAKDHFDI
jgi:hypothetical protein